MTFELVRIGWPNTAAILALALIPVASLATVAERRAAPAQIRQIHAATFCPPDSAAIVAAVLPGTFLE